MSLFLGGGCGSNGTAPPIHHLTPTPTHHNQTPSFLTHPCVDVPAVHRRHARLHVQPHVRRHRPRLRLLRPAPLLLLGAGASAGAGGVVPASKLPPAWSVRSFVPFIYRQPTIQSPTPIIPSSPSIPRMILGVSKPVVGERQRGTACAATRRRRQRRWHRASSRM